MAGKASNYGHPRIHLDLRFELPLAGERFLVDHITLSVEHQDWNTNSIKLLTRHLIRNGSAYHGRKNLWICARNPSSDYMCGS